MADPQAQDRLNQGLAKDGKLTVNFEDEAFVRSQLSPATVPEEVLLHALSYDPQSCEDQQATPVCTSGLVNMGK